MRGEAASRSLCQEGPVIDRYVCTDLTSACSSPFCGGQLSFTGEFPSSQTVTDVGRRGRVEERLGVGVDGKLEGRSVPPLARGA